MTTRAQYLDQKAADLENFVDSARALATNGSDVLDSAGMKSASSEILNSKNIPDSVQEVLALLKDEKDHAKVLDSISLGTDAYYREHGVMPTGDLIQAAMQQAIAAGRGIDKDGRVLDGIGSTSHHDQLSSQPNRIVVAITSAIAEAVPFVTYLPVDIGSNEARLGIVAHQAGKAFGSYAVGDLLDGVNVGKPYVSSERRVQLTLAGDRLTGTGKITGVIGGSEDTQLLRGRTKIYVNGFPCAYESHNTAASTASPTISGTARIAATDYAVTGTVTVATGAVSLTFSPALPAGTVVEAEGYIDFEANPDLTPKILTQVQTYSLFATPWRVLADQTVDSRTQYANELGLDLMSENLMAVRNQFGNERHYGALEKLKALATANAKTYDFDWSGQKAEKTRARIWQDAMAIIGMADQQMCEDTMDHGITHIYVTKKIAAQIQSLPREIFESSGLTVRPGIFRLGRLFGRYEVYYTPRGLTEGSGTAQMLCIGRSTQVARCPIVMGDAVAPMYIPLATGEDMKSKQGFYARNFSEVNPHYPSAMAAALINVTNLGV